MHKIGTLQYLHYICWCFHCFVKQCLYYRNFSIPSDQMGCIRGCWASWPMSQQGCAVSFWKGHGDWGRTCWCRRSANIAPISRQDRKADPGNHSLISVLKKIIQQVLSVAGSGHMKEKKKKTGNSQHGFIKGKATRLPFVAEWLDLGMKRAQQMSH